MREVKKLTIAELRNELTRAARKYNARDADLMIRAAHELAGREEAERVTRRLDMPFEERYTEEPNSGCWLWSGPIGRTGYGVYQTRQGPIVAHRASFQIYKGPIPDGLYVLHKCDVRCCVNPDHLWLGTLSDNMQDMHDKGRHKALRTHCKNGHEQNSENVIIRGGQKRCKICHRAWDRKRKAAAKKRRINEKTASVGINRKIGN